VSLSINTALIPDTNVTVWPMAANSGAGIFRSIVQLKIAHVRTAGKLETTERGKRLLGDFEQMIYSAN
jgi:hypothetical protein